MTIKVIEDKTKQPFKLRIRCDNCFSELEVTNLNDLKFKTKQNTVIKYDVIYFKCPVCKKEINVNLSYLTDYQIKQIKDGRN